MTRFYKFLSVLGLLSGTAHAELYFGIRSDLSVSHEIEIVTGRDLDDRAKTHMREILENEISDGVRPRLRLQEKSGLFVLANQSIQHEQFSGPPHGCVERCDDLGVTPFLKGKFNVTSEVLIFSDTPSALTPYTLEMIDFETYDKDGEKVFARRLEPSDLIVSRQWVNTGFLERRSDLEMKFSAALTQEIKQVVRSYPGVRFRFWLMAIGGRDVHFDLKAANAVKLSSEVSTTSKPNLLMRCLRLLSAGFL